MADKITDRLARELSPPPSGNRIAYDTEIKGFGLRITAKGHKAFILNYSVAGRERRYTIGGYGRDQWTVEAARKKAGELRLIVDNGEDPLAGRVEARIAPTVVDLCRRFAEEHLPKIRPSTQRSYRQIIDGDILPELNHQKVAAVTFSDVDALHRKITRRGASYRANRTIAVLSKMFSLSIRWGWRQDNPVKGIERNQELKRHRYLSGDEIVRLTKALAEHRDQQAANIIRLLLLTGARRGELQAARWGDIDIEKGVWTKPGSTTKQKTMHRVPLSGAARQLLAELSRTALPGAEFVFPSNGSHRSEIKHNWAAICRAAGIKDARMHDLRHTYASILASAGQSLPVIGALLGHSQPATTARYAHIFDDPLRAATERVRAAITGEAAAEIVTFKKASPHD
jgi:integrase